MVANMLHAMGVFMGSDLGAGPHPDWNAKGFFEDGEFCDLYSRAMPAPTMSEFIPSRISIPGKVANRHKDLVRQRQEMGVDWGVKSNRLCYFLADFGGAKLIWCKRRLSASAKSWNARTGISVAESLAMMERCNEAIETALEGFAGDVLTVEYDDVINDADRLAEIVAGFVGRSEKASLASFVVSTDLRRFV